MLVTTEMEFMLIQQLLTTENWKAISNFWNKLGIQSNN